MRWKEGTQCNLYAATLVCSIFIATVHERAHGWGETKLHRGAPVSAGLLILLLCLLSAAIHQDCIIHIRAANSLVLYKEGGTQGLVSSEASPVFLPLPVTSLKPGVS